MSVYLLSNAYIFFSGLMGTNTSIQVHRAWSEPPVVWTMVGAATGSRRSAVIRLLLAPILALQAEKKAQHQTSYSRDRETQREHTNFSSDFKLGDSNRSHAVENGVVNSSLDRALYSGNIYIVV